MRCAMAKDGRLSAVLKRNLRGLRSRHPLPVLVCYCRAIAIMRCHDFVEREDNEIRSALYLRVSTTNQMVGYRRVELDAAAAARGGRWWRHMPSEAYLAPAARDGARRASPTNKVRWNG